MKREGHVASSSALQKPEFETIQRSPTLPDPVLNTVLVQKKCIKKLNKKQFFFYTYLYASEWLTIAALCSVPIS